MTNTIVTKWMACMCCRMFNSRVDEMARMSGGSAYPEKIRC